MNESSKTDMKDLTPETLENIRVGYQAAIDLRTSRADELWSQFNAMAVVQSILVAATVALATAEDRSFASVGIAMLGIFISVMWWQMHKRGTFWIGHYRDSALHYEKQLKGVDTLISGQKRRPGGLTVTRGSIIVIFLFALAHLLLIIFELF